MPQSVRRLCAKDLVEFWSKGATIVAIEVRINISSFIDGRSKMADAFSLAIACPSGEMAGRRRHDNRGYAGAAVFGPGIRKFRV